jgi:selenocysteine-specific translation elongation factor
MFDALLDGLMEEEKPACVAEVELVKKMAEHTWCSERASRLQEGCFLITRTDEQRKNLQGEVVIHPQLERFLRYQAHHDRAYQRASDELLKRRKERLKAERGFASQKQAEAQEERREKQQEQRDELHKFKVATAKSRLEREQTKTFSAQAGAESQISPLEPLQEERIAA